MRWLILVVVVGGCRSSTSQVGVADAGPRRPVEKLEPPEQVVTPAADASVADEREAIFRVATLPLAGPKPPAGAAVLQLDGEGVTSGGQPFDASAVKQNDALVLVPVNETYLVQAAALLARLDDVGADVFLKHPEADIAWPLDLRDEGAFQSWVDDPEPGKVRVIHRADGFELQTNLGKLPGKDPNGPTVPVRGGVMDLVTLQRGLERVAKKFKTKDLCFVPSFGMELAQVSRAMAANWTSADAAWFPTTCLVYPRPRARDGGAR
ncbi:MAG: hypothetical protein INH37_10570 [Myxococcaceae bacterium]|nr:hypothetical protein [Myxococcaceae bacterium]